MERKEIVKSIVEELINELCPATLDNVKKVIQQQYAEKKFGVNCSFRDKLNYIKETIASMFDVQPIQVVGKEHPAKENLKKDKKKEDKCQKQ